MVKKVYGVRTWSLGGTAVSYGGVVYMYGVMASCHAAMRVRERSYYFCGLKGLRSTGIPARRYDFGATAAFGRTARYAGRGADVRWYSSKRSNLRPSRLRER